MYFNAKYHTLLIAFVRLPTYASVCLILVHHDAKIAEIRVRPFPSKVPELDHSACFLQATDPFTNRCNKLVEWKINTLNNSNENIDILNSVPMKQEFYKYVKSAIRIWRNICMKIFAGMLKFPVRRLCSAASRQV